MENNSGNCSKNTKNPKNDKENPPTKIENPQFSGIPLKIDCSALVGLRGLASVHILVFHVLMYSPLKINTMGSIEMPLFFLLSGFSLAVTYGRTKWDGNTSCCFSHQDKDGVILMKTSDFYRNRFARVGLLYFISNLIVVFIVFCTWGVYGPDDEPAQAFILMYKNTGSIMGVALVFAMTLTGTGTWLLGFPILFSGASWTISTLLFFYLVFPNLLPRLQKYTDDQLSKWITILFFIQLLPVFLRIILQIIFGKLAMWLFWPASAWPVSRLPVFIMGVLAGLQCLRGVHHPGSSCCINNVIPWSCSSDPQEHGSKEIIWALRVDGNSVFLIFTSIMFSVMEFYGAVDGPVPQLSLPDFNFYSQFLFIHMQLVIIVGLIADGGRSFLSKICQWKPIQLLGRVSMSLYLIHLPVMELFKISTYGVNFCTQPQYELWKNVSLANNVTNSTQFDSVNTTYEVHSDCSTFTTFNSSKNVLPLWAVPAVIVLCPILAWFITIFIEEPARAALRAKPGETLRPKPNHAESPAITEMEMSTKNQ